MFAPSEAERRELYSEYHLGRQAWRLCKRGTKYCGWHREMPEFYEWRHMCLTYDGFKDLYKVFVDGVKIESGSWTGDRTFEGVRSGLLANILVSEIQIFPQKGRVAVPGSEAGQPRRRFQCSTILVREAESVQHLELAAGGLLHRERRRVSVRLTGQHGGVEHGELVHGSGGERRYLAVLQLDYISL